MIDKASRIKFGGSKVVTNYIGVEKIEWSSVAENDYNEIAKTIVEKGLQVSNIWLFYGEMGSGKTSLIKRIVQELGAEEMASSPSFSIVNEYRYPEGLIYHMDLYRLKSIEEALQIGIEEYLDSGELCFIEWPDLIKDILPERCFSLQLEILENSTRKLNLLESRHLI